MVRPHVKPSNTVIDHFVMGILRFSADENSSHKHKELSHERAEGFHGRFAVILESEAIRLHGIGLGDRGAGRHVQHAAHALVPPD